MCYFKYAFLLVILNTSPLLAANKTVTEIPQVTVHADDERTSSLTTPSNITVITHKQIAKSGANSLAEFLASQSILKAMNAFGDNSQTAISMRGFGDNAVANSLILVDGFRLTNPDITTPDINTVALADIERIEIIPGSAGTLYGDQAVGGVINIITRHPQKFATHINTAYGSYNHKIYSGSIEDKFNNGLSYQVDGFKDDTNNYRRHNTQNIGSFSGKLIYDYANGSAFFKYQRYKNDLLYSGSLSLEQVKDNPRQSFDNKDFRNGLTNDYQIGFKHNLSDRWILASHLEHHDLSADGFISQPFKQTHQVNNLDTRVIGLLDKNTLTFGGYFENNHYSINTSLFNNNAQAKQHSVFAQDIIQLMPKLDLILGARYAEQDNYLQTSAISTLNFKNKAFVSEQGLSYQLAPAWRIYLHRDGNFRFPKANENTLLPSNVEHLDAQTGVSYETGVEWKQVADNFKLTIYQLRLKNEIAFDPTQTALQPFGANRNIGPTIRNGLAISAKHQLTLNWDIAGEYAYVDPRFAAGPFKNNVIPGVANHLAGINIYYHVNEQLKFLGEELYVGNHYASDDDANASAKINGYYLTNLGMQFEMQTIKVNLRINNIFNKFYNFYTSFDPNTSSISYYPAPGRNLMLSIGFNFG